MIQEDKFKEAREKVVDNFLTKVEDANNLDDLRRNIFATCAAMGLTFDKERREFIRTKFVNVYPLEQTFKEFKRLITDSLREYLRTQIK